MKKFFLVVLLLFGLCSCTKANKMKKEMLEYKDFCSTKSNVNITIHLTFYENDTYDFYYNDSSTQNSEYEVKGKEFSHVKTFTNKYKTSVFSSGSGLYRNEKQTLSVYLLHDFGGTEERENKYAYFIFKEYFSNIYYTNDSPDILKNKSYYDKFKNEYGLIELPNEVQPRSNQTSKW